jgi:hypothetical protein
VGGSSPERTARSRVRRRMSTARRCARCEIASVSGCRSALPVEDLDRVRQRLLHRVLAVDDRAGHTSAVAVERRAQLSATRSGSSIDLYDVPQGPKDARILSADAVGQDPCTASRRGLPFTHLLHDPPSPSAEAAEEARDERRRRASTEPPVGMVARKCAAHFVPPRGGRCRRKQVQRRRLGTPVVRRDADQDVVGFRLGVLHEHVEVAVPVEMPVSSSSNSSPCFERPRFPASSVS